MPEPPFASIFVPQYDEGILSLLIRNLPPLHARLTSTGKRATAWQMIRNPSPDRLIPANDNQGPDGGSLMGC
jgi:hypothetical protein